MLGLRKYRYEGTLYGAGIAYGHQWILGETMELRSHDRGRLCTYRIRQV